MEVTAMQRLETAISKVKQRGYVPKEGKVVVAAYQAGELHDMEELLYIVAELLSPIN